MIEYLMEIVLQSHFVKTSSGEFHFKTFEDLDETKPYAIFIHGAHRQLQNALYWQPLAGRIKESFNPFFVDLLGHGESEFHDSPNRISPEQQIIGLLELIMHLQTTYTVGALTLVGRSYGGYIAMKIADELPHRINGLFLIAPAVNSEIIALLNGWKNPVSVFWDSKDPVVNISNFSYILSALPQAKLYAIGSPASFNTFSKYKVYERPDVAGTHIPEREFPDYFFDALEEFKDDVLENLLASKPQ
ncbi:MAG: alpha/beta fold hydrolase [Methanobacteriota archaeon]|nr:MAG: alpha/beta fold hydrolase [Euryarchaeota archaeon]